MLGIPEACPSLPLPCVVCGGHDKAAKMYRFMVWFFKTITYIFFDDIEIVGQDKIPLEGPVIFVGAQTCHFVRSRIRCA